MGLLNRKPQHFGQATAPRTVDLAEIIVVVAAVDAACSTKVVEVAEIVVDVAWAASAVLVSDADCSTNLLVAPAAIPVVKKHQQIAAKIQDVVVA